MAARLPVHAALRPPAGTVSSPNRLSLAQAALEIREGRVTSAGLVQACLARIDAVEGEVGAWAHLDRDHALARAEAADLHRREGRPLGPLHGVPVGVKDILDTADQPTEFGSTLYAGRTPRRDARAVADLRAAGAVILGKTVTTEFAFRHPGRTRNPLDPRRTPGGSSSGSAAAVAAMMVPGALGSQTNGSVIRPASFCGVVGYKPSFGLVPRSGVLALSRHLDHVGVFARTVEDAALLIEAMAGHDEADPDTRPIARPPLAALAASEPPLPPRFAFIRTPAWDQAEPVTREAFAEVVATLGDRVSEIELPSPFVEVAALHRVIMEVEIASNLRREYAGGGDQLSAPLRALIERAKAHPAVDYVRAIEGIEWLNEMIAPIFDEYDAILTPAATGEAPIGLADTGNPAFCTPWTYLGTPALSLPLLQGPAGMPLGVQLVGRRGDDGRLLRTARWLASTLAAGRGVRRAAGPQRHPSKSRQST